MKNIILFIIAIIAISATIQAEDWPMYMKDNTRSGVCNEKLTLSSKPQWIYKTTYAPSPSFKWGEIVDENNRRGGHKLGNKLTEVFKFDFVYSPVVANSKLYFGSSTEENLICLDAETGKNIWTYFTEGAIRLAPTVVNNKVYFGSDDGFAYCLNAVSGELIWKVNVAPENRKVIMFGRMASLWSIMTGVTIKDGVAYFAGGVFPTDGNTNLFAVNADSGKIIWKIESVFPALGHILISGDYITVPSGRAIPYLYSIKDGKEKTPFSTILPKIYHQFIPRTHGGCFVGQVDGMNVCGPSEYSGILLNIDKEVEANFVGGRGSKSTFSKMRVKLKAFKGFRILNGFSSYFILRDDIILSVEKKAFHENIKIMKAKVGHTGWKYIDISKNKLKTGVQWENKNNDGIVSIIRTKNMLIGGGNGKVIAWDLSNGKELWQADIEGSAYELIVANNKLYASTDKGYIYCFSDKGNDNMISSQIKGLNTSDETTKFVKEIINQSEKSILDTQGFCLVIGAGNGELLYELVKKTNFMIVCLENDDTKITKIRKLMAQSGVYGKRLVCHKINPLKAKYPANYANIVVLNEEVGFSLKQMYKFVHPFGGVLIANKSTHKQLQNNNDIPKWEDYDNFAVITKGNPKGAGEWTHLYANAANTLSSDDEILDKEFEVQWFGGPSLEKQWGYHNNVPGPLFKDGRMFLIGEETVSAIDAYNGTALWETTVSGIHRPGVPNNAGPACLDNQYLYLTAKSSCVIINPKNGEKEGEFTLTENSGHWGYLAASKGFVFGTIQNKNAELTKRNATPFSGWGKVVPHVIGEEIFAFNVETKKKEWSYKPKGGLVNSSICIGENNIVFVENVTLDSSVKKTGRCLLEKVTSKGLNIVALNLKTGKESWRTHVDEKTTHCLYLMYKNKSIIAVTTFLAKKSKTRKPEVMYTFSSLNSMTGKIQWIKPIKRLRDGQHNGMIQHPAIINDKIYLTAEGGDRDKLNILDLVTGKEESISTLNREKACSVLTGSKNGLFGRSGGCAMFHLSTETVVPLSRETRPRCWLTIIPAGGLVMMPEGGVGCVCASALMNTIVLAPKQ